jgi:hypothetical protein
VGLERDVVRWRFGARAKFQVDVGAVFSKPLLVTIVISVMTLCACAGPRARAPSSGYLLEPTLKCLTGRPEYRARPPDPTVKRPFTFGVIPLRKGLPQAIAVFFTPQNPVFVGGDERHSTQEFSITIYRSEARASRVYADITAEAPPPNSRLRDNVIILGHVSTDLTGRRPVLNLYWRIVEGCLRN